MKDYNEKYSDRAAEFEIFLEAIVAELPCWTLVDVPADEQAVQTCRIRFITHDYESYKLCAHYEVAEERICFSPSEWPKYTDTNGRECSKRPNELYGTTPRPASPETRCKTYRGAGSIARQIQSKVIDDYMALYEMCCEAAHSEQEYTDKTDAGIEKVRAACRQAMPVTGRSGRSFYIREIEGEAPRVEFNSVGDVRLHLSAADAASVINFLRSKRNRNSKRAQS